MTVSHAEAHANNWAHGLIHLPLANPANKGYAQAEANKPETGVRKEVAAPGNEIVVYLETKDPHDSPAHAKLQAVMDKLANLPDPAGNKKLFGVSRRFCCFGDM